MVTTQWPTRTKERLAKRAWIRRSDADHSLLGPRACALPEVIDTDLGFMSSVSQVRRLATDVLASLKLSHYPRSSSRVRARTN
jgi:hypothetical protein